MRTQFVATALSPLDGDTLLRVCDFTNKLFFIYLRMYYLHRTKFLPMHPQRVQKEMILFAAYKAL